MTSYSIHENVHEALSNYELPQKLGFGLSPGPVMYSAKYADGIWGEGILEANRPLQIQPSAKVLHYGQEIFEGMKAYRIDQERANLFRPERNWQRFNLSAKRMAMPEISQQLFMEGVYLVTAYSEAMIPAEPGKSLYLRPFMFASEPSLEVTGANQFVYMVIASPSESIHAGTMKVLIERDYTRAAIGGTGAAKTGGNYAASFASRQRAMAMGYHQSLWLDPVNQQNIEELSVMNFFAVINDELYTPALTGSLLDGITRDSIIQLAGSMGIRVYEQSLNIDELIRQIQSTDCSELFCCGTGAILSPIGALGEYNGTEYQVKYPDGKLSLAIREQMLGIQERRLADPYQWVQMIPDEYYPHC